MGLKKQNKAWKLGRDFVWIETLFANSFPEQSGWKKTPTSRHLNVAKQFLS